jgi:hypothetical protein
MCAWICSGSRNLGSKSERRAGPSGRGKINGSRPYLAGLHEPLSPCLAQHHKCA